MGEKKKKGEGKTSNSFDYKKELNSLAEKKAIPKKIADKLTQKLDEKNVKITKNQLDTLLNKIRDVMEKYANGKAMQSGKTETSKLEQDYLKNITESMEKLEERLESLEVEILGEESTVSSDDMVTTDDIEVPYKKAKVKAFVDDDPLNQIPSDPESIIVLMKWLQFLVDRCSRSNLSEILDYYVDIGWISDEAKIKLLDYSNGITEENKKTDVKKISDLPSKDHIQSLIFIQKLKGQDFDKHFIDKVDSKLSRMTKKIDESNIK